MKIKPILYALALLMSIINAMERDDWQKTPGQQLGGRGQQSSLIPTTRRPSSPPRRPASPPTPSAAGPASVAGRSPTAPSAGAPTTPSSMPPAGFMRSGQRQSGAALPPSEVESKSTTSMTTSPEITPATAAASVQESSKIPGSITLQSNISAQPRDHIIRPDAIQYAQTIKTMVDVSEDTQTPIEIPYPYTEEQVRLAADLVNFIAQHTQDTQLLPPQHALIDFIINHTHNFERISFVDTLAIINFLDIPLAFDAIVSIRQPLPLPRNREEELRYNQQLSSVASLTRGSRDRRLFQLLSSMLYPGCLQHQEIAQIIATIPQELQHTILGDYMQSHPELYQHSIKTINNAHIPQFTADGQIVAIRSGDNIILIDNITGLSIRTINNIYCTDLSPNGQTITARSERNILLINTTTGTIICTINDALSHQFSPDGQILAVESERNILLINTTTGATIRTIPNTRIPQFSPNGQIIAVESAGNILLINTATGATIRTILNARMPQFSPDGQIIAVESADNILLINTTTGAIIRIINQPDAYYIFQRIFFSPDGKILATISKDSFMLINAHDGTRIGKIISTINNAYDPQFSPNGKIVAISSSAKNTILINTETGSIIYTINNAENPRFSPDGSILITTTYQDYSSTLNIRGYSLLREALQSPIAILPPTAAPVIDGSSAAPAAASPAIAAPAALRRTAVEPEEEAVILADPRFDQMGRPAIPAQEQQTAAAAPVEPPAAHVTAPAITAPAPVVSAAAGAPSLQPAPRRGVLGAISNWWYGKKQ